MDKYLTIFESHSQYVEPEVKPNVSYCIQEDEVHYNPFIPPIIDGYEYVDLGLPSGTLWATMNIGATEPLDPGHLFSWGGINPTCCPTNECEGKNYFWWDSYELSTNGGTLPGTTDYKLNKYCPSGKSNNYYASGFSGDSLTQLLSTDDAATINWGENWELPTQEQILELINNTTLTYVTYLDNTTYTLTGPNGNTITFYNSGNSWAPSTSSQAPCYFTYPMYVYVWSKDLDTNAPYKAYILRISSSGSQIESMTRAVGIPIRPVLKTPQITNFGYGFLSATVILSSELLQKAMNIKLLSKRLNESEYHNVEGVTPVITDNVIEFVSSDGLERFEPGSFNCCSIKITYTLNGTNYSTNPFNCGCLL